MLASPSAASTTPHVRGRFLVGHGPDILRRPLALFHQLAQHGDVVRFDLPGMPAVLVNHPDLIKHVLQDSKTFDKQMRSYLRMRALVGDGLATSDGEHWLRQRRIAQPAFQRRQLHDFAAVMVRFAAAARDDWHARAGQPIDVVADMTRLTLGVACEALLGGDAPDEAAVLADSFAEVLAYLVDRLNRLWYLPLWAPTRDNLRCRRALASLDRAIYRLIARRRAQTDASLDLLWRMMQARDADTGAAMSDLQLRDEMVTMLLGGHETTAMTLTWATCLLAEHPEVQDRLRDELTRVLGDRDPGPDDLERLPYLGMVVDETLRLYPPVWLVARNAARDVELGGHHIPHGTAVFVSPYTIQRAPALWEAPAAFWPERFAPELAAERPRHAFIPFVTGPRQCIGNNFALLEARLVLATLARRLRVRMAPGSVAVPEPILTLRPRDGVRIIVDPA